MGLSACCQSPCPLNQRPGNSLKWMMDYSILTLSPCVSEMDRQHLHLTFNVSQFLEKLDVISKFWFSLKYCTYSVSTGNKKIVQLQRKRKKKEHSLTCVDNNLKTSFYQLCWIWCDSRNGSVFPSGQLKYRSKKKKKTLSTDIVNTVV